MNAQSYIPVFDLEHTFAGRVRMAREVVGLSQREAARKCGLTIGEWQGIEGGVSPRDLPRKLLAISNGLRNEDGRPVDIDWLLWGPDKQEIIAPLLQLARTDYGSIVLAA